MRLPEISVDTYVTIQSRPPRRTTILWSAVLLYVFARKSAAVSALGAVALSPSTS